jgi:nucleoside-diphosphate-sugar epimerase
MNTVLITGATGFIGQRLVRRLLQQDVRVRVMVRDPARLAGAVRSRVDVVQGELGGADHVLHLAALATACTRHPRDYARLNAEAVALLLDAAARAGVRRFVHVSSIAALPPVESPRVSGFARFGPTEYAASKAASEVIVRRYVANGHDAVIVRPTRVYGPGPWNDANGATRLIVMYVQGRLRVRPADRGVHANWVHVDDVAAGIELAARRGRCGGEYELGGENASLREYLAQVAEVTGVTRTVVPVPPAALLPAAWLGKAWARAGGRASLTPEWLANFLEHRPVDSAAARRDLGFAPRALQAGLAETVDWIARQQKGPWHVEIRSHA